MACLRSLTVIDKNDRRQTKIQLQHGGRVLFNDIEALIYRPTYARLSEPILVSRTGPSDVQLMFSDGMKLTYDGATYVFIDAPPSLHNRTSGLCGNFDLIAENDMQTPAGNVAVTPELFADAWRANDDTLNGDDPLHSNNHTHTAAAAAASVAVLHPCMTNKSQVQRALNVCAMLKSNIFKECSVDPQPYYDNCMYDMCACQGDRAACICPIFAAYGNECERQSMPVQWRTRFSVCRR